MSNSSSDDEEVPVAVPLGAQDAQYAAQATAHAGSKQETVPAAADEAVQAPAAVVPITLITGYLGAGKTTLVNHVLTAKHGYRCAVLLNEIADSADIERALVKEPEGQDAAPLADWTELENGCICCSAKNDMVKALESLMQQRARFDYVLIETTGLANPGPVAAALWTDEQLESSVCLDCVVTVVDARNVERQLADLRPDGAVNEAQQQVAFADVVLLNKVDLASEEQLQRIEAAVHDMNAEAAVLRCQRCEIDLGRILNTGIYSAGMAAGQEASAHAGTGAAAAGAAAAAEPTAAGAAAAPDVGDAGGEQQPQCGDPQCSEAGPHHHEHHGVNGPGPHRSIDCSSSQHDSRVGTVTIRLPGRALLLPRLRHWLDMLLWDQGGEADGGATAQGPSTTPAASTADTGAAAAATAGVPEIFRIKGLLHVSGSSRKHVLQGVHEIYDVVEGPEWAAAEQRGSKLVFIGRRLPREALQKGLEACLEPL